MEIGVAAYSCAGVVQETKMSHPGVACDCSQPLPPKFAKIGVKICVKIKVKIGQPHSVAHDAPSKFARIGVKIRVKIGQPNFVAHDVQRKIGAAIQGAHQRIGCTGSLCAEPHP